MSATGKVETVRKGLDGIIVYGPHDTVMVVPSASLPWQHDEGQRWTIYTVARSGIAFERLGTTDSMRGAYKLASAWARQPEER